MTWERAEDIVHYGHVGHVVEEKGSLNWVVAGLGFFAAAILLVVLVLLVVSNADFDTGPAKVVPTTGPCEPFCTGTPPPPAP
ncbi:hypothetical protein AB0H49_12880 [Nocardia sp. NPDC050713]|uniref:hypothetical protein n=1 Tax=unclassified Nocardia TaxID=2637762 RepID=UPI0033B50CF3